MSLKVPCDVKSPQTTFTIGIIRAGSRSYADVVKTGALGDAGEDILYTGRKITVLREHLRLHLPHIILNIILHFWAFLVLVLESLLRYRGFRSF